MRGVAENASLQEIAAALRILLDHGQTVGANQQWPALPAEPTRRLGSCKGEFTVPDDFDDPLPEDIQAAFEGR